jgi:hypothetical protein
MLHALRDVREFRLVELVGEDNVLQLTSTGGRTAGVVRGNGIRTEARKKLLMADGGEVE